MISVVTITYNNYEELVKTLDSLRLTKNIESIVINGGSCEKTAALLKNHPGPVIQEKDSGISDAFNKGLKLAQGDAVAYLNSGDVLLEADYYSRAQDVLTQEPKFSYVYADLHFEDAVAGKTLFKCSTPSLAFIGRGMPFPHPTMVVRKSVMAKVGEFKLEYKIAMDYEWVIRLLEGSFEGKKISGLPVWMDGTGVSAHSEEKALGECERALREHGLLSGTIQSDFIKRRIKFRTRKFVHRFFGDSGLRLLKGLKGL